MDRNTNFCPASLADLPSLSARRAWIEISVCFYVVVHSAQSLSARRAWIEINGRSVEFHLYASLSARRAWIEIEVPSSAPYAELVALRKESVDRNFLCVMNKSP